MSTFRNPVGPQSPQTYWRRRLMVAIGLVAVIVVIILIVSRPGGTATPAADTTKTPVSDTAADDTAETPAPDGVCADGVVAVTAVTDADDYISGQQPLLSLSIVNNGTTACAFSIPVDQQVYTVTSGEDVIWKSTDCLTVPAVEVELEPGVAVPSTPFTWDRTRSDPTTCEATDRAQVAAGGATYRLGVSVNGVESEDTKAFLLN
jgi:hypothetical protein